MPDTPSLQLTLDRPSHTYPVHFKPLSQVPALLAAADLRVGRCIVITDTNVKPLYSEKLLEALTNAGWAPHEIVVPAGEATKSLPHLSTVYNKILELQIDRQTPVLALGGGVVGDLAGFAAASVLRGVPLVHLPTTLIGQADSSIGGKTGINHKTGKNLIGAFYQPELVCADPQTLQSLPLREWTSGLGEVVKYAYIVDPELFSYLTENWTTVLNRNPEAIEVVVPRSAAIKVDVVREDEREAGRRAILNFGHTVGHAIEKASGYGTFTHGEAIALGMVAALYLSHQQQPEFPLEKALTLVERLPVHHGLDDLSFDKIWQVMHNDKKVKNGQIRYILLQEIGTPYVTADIPKPTVQEAWQYTKDYARARLSAPQNA